MFQPTYIEKCIKHKDDIEYLIGQSRRHFKKPPDQELPRYIFEVNDFFHHHELMDQNEVRIVKEVIAQSFLSAGVQFEEYPIHECVIIPTEEQLILGFEATCFSFRSDLRGRGPEALLDYRINMMHQ